MKVTCVTIIGCSERSMPISLAKDSRAIWAAAKCHCRFRWPKPLGKQWWACDDICTTREIVLYQYISCQFRRKPDLCKAGGAISFVNFHRGANSFNSHFLHQICKYSLKHWFVMLGKSLSIIHETNWMSLTNNLCTNRRWCTVIVNIIGNYAKKKWNK